MIRKIYFLDLLKLSLSRGWVAHLRIFITVGLFGLAVLETLYMLGRAGLEAIYDEGQIWYDREIIKKAELRKIATIERLEKMNKDSGIREIKEDIGE